MARLAARVVARMRRCTCVLGGICLATAFDCARGRRTAASTARSSTLTLIGGAGEWHHHPARYAAGDGKQAFHSEHSWSRVWRSANPVRRCGGAWVRCTGFTSAATWDSRPTSEQLSACLKDCRFRNLFRELCFAAPAGASHAACSQRAWTMGGLRRQFYILHAATCRPGGVAHQRGREVHTRWSQVADDLIRSRRACCSPAGCQTAKFRDAMRCDRIGRMARPDRGSADGHPVHPCDPERSLPRHARLHPVARRC